MDKHVVDASHILFTLPFLHLHVLCSFTLLKAYFANDIRGLAAKNSLADPVSISTRLPSMPSFDLEIETLNCPPYRTMLRKPRGLTSGKATLILVFDGTSFRVSKPHR